MEFLVREETKATRHHQVTIPKKIWKILQLKEGARFTVALTQDHRIHLEPRRDDSELTDQEWDELITISSQPANISKRFKSTGEAIKYLRDL